MQAKVLVVLRLMLLCLIVVAIGAHGGRILGYSVERSGKKLMPPELAEVKKIFRDAVSLRQEKNGYAVLDAAGNALGKLLDYRRETEDIIGYGGPTPLFLAVAANDRVAGLVCDANEETPEFLNKISQAKFFEKWNGRSINEAADLRVDAVTGATMTSQAIAQTVKTTLARHGAGNKSDASGTAWTRDTWIGFAVLALALFCFFCPRKANKFRFLLLLVNVIVLGLYLGWFVAMAQMRGWIVNGIQFGVRPALALIVLSALLLPLFTGKGFYCVYLCPFGSCQDLIAKLPIKRRPLWPWLRSIRPMLFATLVLLVVIGIPLNLTNWEPFSAFIPSSASGIVLTLAATFLLLSFVIHRPWCNIACPTGQLLEILRGITRKADSSRKGEEQMKPMEVVSVLLAVALIVLILQAGGMPGVHQGPSQQGQSLSAASANEVIRVIHQRKSVRKYTGQPVGKEQLEVLLKAGMAAPTAGNKQPWVFVVVTGKETLARFAETLPYAKMASQASAAIVVCGDTNLTFPEEEGKLYWVQDCAAASENILLAAEAIGLGAVWTAVYPASDRVKTVTEILGLPAHIIPLNVIPLGYPTGAEKPKNKYKAENIHWEKW